MTDLRPDTEYLSDAQLDAIAALDVNLADDASIRAAEDRRRVEVTEAQQDDLQSLRRKFTADYLKAREAHEDNPEDIEAWARRDTWADVMVQVLVATGDYLTVKDARAAVQLLTFPQAAERFTELWAAREDLLWDLDSSAVCAVADSVRDWVADGGELGQAPMRSWASPYLAVRR